MHCQLILANKIRHIHTITSVDQLWARYKKNLRKEICSSRRVAKCEQVN